MDNHRQRRVVAAHGTDLKPFGDGEGLQRFGEHGSAKAERFFKTLKEEEVHLMDYEDEAEARQRLPKFIGDLYNRKRLHSALGYLTLVEFEQICLQPVPH